MMQPSQLMKRHLQSSICRPDFNPWYWGGYLLNTTCLFALWMMADVAAFYLRTPDHVSIWYPPSGLSLAFLTYFGWRFAPVVFLVKLASLFINWRGEVSASKWIPAILFTTLLSMAEAVLLSRVMAQAEKLRTFRFTLYFVAIAFLFPAFKAMLFTGFLTLLGIIDPLRFTPTFLAFWGGDALGNLSFTLFFLLTWFPWQDELIARFTKRRAGQFGPMPAILGKATLVWWQWPLDISLTLVLLLCIKWQAPGEQHRFWYLMIYPLLAVTLHAGLRGASLLVPVISLALVWSESWSFSGAEHLYVQIFFATIGALGLLTGALVTEQWDATDKFAELKKKLDAANEIKSRFLTSLAEEIRAPLLHIVRGQAHLGLAATATIVPDAGAMPLREWEEHGDLLLGRLQNLLDNLGTTGKQVRKTTEVSLAEIIGKQMIHLAGFAASCGVTMKLSRRDADVTIKTDVERFEQGMGYLLQAAIRLGQGATIGLSYHAESHLSGESALLTVHMTRLSPDIPAGLLRRIFNNGEPVDIDYVPTGSMLGLVLGKYLLEELGIVLHADVDYFGRGLKLSLRASLAKAKGGVRS